MMICPACGQQTARIGEPLTVRQRELYEWLVAFENAHHTFPTFSDIAVAFGFESSSTAHEHIQTLIRKGWVVRASATGAKRPYATVRAA